MSVHLEMQPQQNYPNQQIQDIPGYKKFDVIDKLLICGIVATLPLSEYRYDKYLRNEQAYYTHTTPSGYADHSNKPNWFLGDRFEDCRNNLKDKYDNYEDHIDECILTPGLSPSVAFWMMLSAKKICQYLSFRFGDCVRSKCYEPIRNCVVRRWMPVSTRPPGMLQLSSRLEQSHSDSSERLT